MEKFNKIFSYFYDSAVEDFPLGNINTAANIFEAKKDTEDLQEQLTAVSVGLKNRDTACTVEVYTNLTDETDPTGGTLAATGKISYEHAGIYTIPLDKSVNLQPGSKFAVVAKTSSAGGSAYIRLSQNAGNGTDTSDSPAQIINIPARPAALAVSAKNETAAVKWSADQKILTGYENQLFLPDNNITREEFTAMLWRYAGSPAPQSTIAGYRDMPPAGSWSAAALCWAVETGIIQGRASDTLAPHDYASCAEIAAMVMRFVESAGNQ